MPRGVPGGHACLGECMPRGMHATHATPVDRMTDTCENISLPQTSVEGGKNNPPLSNSSSVINQITISIPRNNKPNGFNNVFKNIHVN